MSLAARFRDRDVLLGGVRGEVVEIPSANPLNYWQVISDPGAMPRVTVDATLFRPPRAAGAVPVVLVVPGSLGIAPTHLRHAETLLELGIAACVLDPFGPRGVTSTVANQTQYSFAASAYDVAAAVAVLARRPDLDARRIGLQGHSRGGSAVLTAATRRFCEAVHDPALCVRSVLAVYPWSGHQFLDPAVGAAEIRAIVGDRDEWVGVQEIQGHIQAIRLRGAVASLRIVGGAGHSFDREERVRQVPDARVSPCAPTGYIADDGAFIHPLTGEPDSKLVDRDLAVYALKAGYGRRGAAIGSEGDQPALFRDEMIRFFRRTLLERS